MSAFVLQRSRKNADLVTFPHTCNSSVCACCGDKGTELTSKDNLRFISSTGTAPSGVMMTHLIVQVEGIRPVPSYSQCLRRYGHLRSSRCHILSVA